MYVNARLMLLKALDAGYAVPSFNINGLEDIRGCLEAAEQARSPVILQVYGGVFKRVPPDVLAAMADACIRRANVPVALHLDHGSGIAEVSTALRHGFTSVMVDGSRLPYEENVALVKLVVEMAHAVDVPVEAELGHVGGATERLTEEERIARLTDPDQAADFVKRTGVDSLAVSIGNAHGRYPSPPDLDLARLERVAELTSVPLVMHGGSDSPPEQVRQAVSLGVAKFNVGTDIGIAFTDALIGQAREAKQRPWGYAMLDAARAAVKEVALAYIAMLGSAGYADEDAPWT